MPSTFTRTPTETERKEPGIGGKPPVDRRPTGGGGGGGDDDWQNESRGPRELLHRVRFFVFSALAADMLFFAVLVLVFFARQAGLQMDPRTHEFRRDWIPVRLPQPHRQVPQPQPAARRRSRSLPSRRKMAVAVWQAASRPGRRGRHHVMLPVIRSSRAIGSRCAKRANRAVTSAKTCRDFNCR